LGQYDIIVIFDVPDDETAFRVMLNLGKQGNIRTSTMKAIGEQDMTKILQGIA
jgi:uncharacterized protein with GYD domain